MDIREVIRLLLHLFSEESSSRFSHLHFHLRHPCGLIFRQQNDSTYWISSGNDWSDDIRMIFLLQILADFDFTRTCFEYSFPIFHASLHNWSYLLVHVFFFRASG